MVLAVPWGHQVYSGGRTVWFPSTLCKGSASRLPIMQRNLGGRREDRYRLSRGQARISFTAPYSTTFGMKYWMPTTGLPTVRACLSLKSVRMTSEERSAAQFLEIRHSFSSRTKDSGCGSRKLHSQLCPILTRANLQYQPSSLSRMLTPSPMIL